MRPFMHCPTGAGISTRCFGIRQETRPGKILDRTGKQQRAGKLARTWAYVAIGYVSLES